MVYLLGVVVPRFVRHGSQDGIMTNAQGYYEANVQEATQQGHHATLLETVAGSLAQWAEH